jgi:beta-glucosidase
MNSHTSQATGRLDTEAKINDLLNRMTLEEQVSLLSGEDFWSVAELPHLDIGKLRATDGPNGARGSGSVSQGMTSAAFPVGIAMGASWNVELVESVARAIAEETKSKGAQVCLAPTVNVLRSVTNGRNFECFSEDPELSAKLTVAYIRGLQSEGVAATVKHFAGNESEFERTTMNSQIDERSLREVYLRPFEAAVKEADTWGVMSSYNKLNGTYAAENEWLLSTVLREEWGFDGVVVSDWFGSRSTAPTVNAGLDLEMPGPTRDRGEKLVAAVESGEVSPETVCERARSMLRLMSRVGILDDLPVFEEISDDRPEHRALIRKAGAECAVLLKNGDLLPLTSPKGKIAVIGPNAKVAQIMGGGSSQLNPHYQVSPWDGLANKLGQEALVYTQGCQNHRWEPIIRGQMDVEFFESDDLDGPAVSTETLHASVDFFHPPTVEGKIAANSFAARIRTKYTAEESGSYSFGLHSAGKARLLVNGTKVVEIWDDWKKGRTFFEEGCDEVTGLIDLLAGQTYDVVMEFQTVPAANLVNPAFRFGVSRPLGDQAIAEAIAAAENCETALLFVGRSGEWDTEGSDLDHINLPGRQDELIRAVAAANPRTIVVLQTGGPVEMPWLQDVPSVLQAWYPGQEVGNAITDVLFGDTEPTGRLPQTFPTKWEDNPAYSDDPEVYPGKNSNVRYDEGVFIGYRHYEANNIVPMFPFGHGLGYTQFDMGNLRLSEVSEGVSASVSIRNTGDRAGSTVVQFYVSDNAASVPRPEKELKAFNKVELAAGETSEVSLTLSDRDFAYFDAKAGAWRVEEGSFTVSVGFSAADLRASTQISRDSQILEK